MALISRIHLSKSSATMELRLIAIVCLLGAAFAGPVQRESGSRCSTKCLSQSNQKFNYEPGKKYVYQYSGENFISIAGQQKQKATIEGLAEIHVVDRCEMVLKLKDLRVQQKLSQQEIRELEQQLELPLRFSFEDGQIENVCPSEEDENPLSLNIKKGVISTLINTMSKLDSSEDVKEMDSLGKCDTKYTVKYAQGLEVQKEKSLKSCTNRHSSVTSLITNAYESPDSQVHTLPIFPEEELTCKQQIEDRIIKRVYCKEQATIKPLKNRESVIQFEGKVELKLLSQDRAERFQMQSVKVQEPITYNLDEEKGTEGKVREVEQILQQLCKSTGAVDKKVSKHFIRLVQLVKNLSHQQLDKIHKQLKSGQICSEKKVWDTFVDTLPMAGTDASIKLMVELLEQKEITGLKSKIWPASLALVPRPSSKALEAITPLLRGEISAPVLLGVSAMVNRFCSSSENCDHVQSAQQITEILNERLGQKCSNEDESEILAVLKAFGNMGHIGSAEKNILSCASDSDKPARLRLAAIDAFRRTQKQRPEGLLQLYQNTQEDSEIRIAALSSVIKQASRQQIQAIKRTAEQEKDEQVNAYAATLIKNMRTTSSPLKQTVRDLLQEIKVQTPKVSYWDNSKNVEFSAFSEFLNVGGSVEADVIHSQESKIPRSIYTRFDVDVFDKNMNLFEIGMRAEGLESIVQKLIGLKDKIPNKPSWNLLSSKNLIGDSDVEASLFVRAMNTEIFDIAASDLTGISEMIKIAEWISKMAEEQKADFSHSFLFLNSKVVIPSVTGRAYSFGVTGSATVGLTAESKFDLTSFPHNADVKAHFQPSANVEIATTVGIQSNQHRPDVKLVSRLHLESHMKATFKIKDSHVALVSVEMPSEHVVLAKISSDVVEIDAQHQEKKVNDMQKKLDYCFDQLEKPLGVSVCGQLEVPKPFISKAFPYVHGFGNLEFSIKKTDPSLKEFQLKLQIPKHAGQVMKYEASFDTPGSQISRRFAAELEVRQQSRDQQQFSIELTSPFKQAGGSGFWTNRQDRLESSVEMHSGSTQWLKANASAQIEQSSSRQVIRPSLEVSIMNQRPLRIGGSVSLTGGRKQEISIDIKANKPSNKPIAIRGTIMKDGPLELSRQAEWKVSSDLALETPLADAQLRGHVEKQSKQAEYISTRLSVDYQKARSSQKHSIKFSGTTQRSASKIATNAQLETSQFPSANFAANWDMQGDIRQSLRNDLTIKYGRNPEKQYVNLKLKSRMPENGAGDCKISIKAPQHDIDSELTIQHDIQGGQTPRVKIDADLQYQQDKHVTGLFHVNYASSSPLKASSRIELEYPGRKLAYRDEIEEVSQDSYVGRAQVQWGQQQSEQAELKYQLQTKSNQQKLHHELETSLTAPQLDAPIKSKMSLQMSSENFGIEGRLNLPKNVEYSVQANMNKQGPSHIQLKTPKVEGNLKASNDEEKKSFDLDMKVKTRRPRRITASATADMGKTKNFEVEVQWDADRKPEKRVAIATMVQTSGSQYSSKSELQIVDLLKVQLQESGDLSIIGSHEASLEASIKDQEPISIQYQQQVSQEHAKTVIKFAKRQVQKAHMELEGTLRQRGESHEWSVKAWMKSLDNSFEEKQFQIQHQMTKQGSSKSMQNSVQLQMSQQQVYQAEWSSEMQPQRIEMKAQLQTPHQQYDKQSVSVSLQKSNDEVSASASIELPQKQEISASGKLQKSRDGLKTTISVKSPFQQAKDAKLHLEIENQQRQKRILSYIDVNSARLSEIQASLQQSQQQVELEAQMKISSIPDAPFQGLQVSYQQSRGQAQLSGKVQMDSRRQVEFQSELKKQSQGISATVSINSPFKQLQDAKIHLSAENQASKRSVLFFVDHNSQRKADAELKMVFSSPNMEIQGRVKTARTPEVSAQVQLQNSRKAFALSANVMKGSNPLLKTQISKQQQQQKMEYKWEAESLGKSLLNFHVASERSNSEQKHSISASGPFSPMHLKFSTSQQDKNSDLFEFTACQADEQSQQRQHQRQPQSQQQTEQQAQQGTCLTLKGTHKSLEDSQSYRHYKRVSIELQKRTRQEPEPTNIASSHVILSIGDYDYRSKVLLLSRDQTYGYEVRVHKKKDSNDRHSVETTLFRPSTTSRVRASVKQHSKEALVEFEVTPDISDANRKYQIEMKVEQVSREAVAYMKMASPQMKKPITMTAKVQTQNGYPVAGKMELDYSQQHGKALTLEVTADLSRSGQQSVSYELSSEDKSLEASLKLQRQQTSQEQELSYEWQLKTPKSSEQKGGATLKYSQKKNGQPQSVELAYYSPSADYQIHAHQQKPQASITVQSKGQKLTEIILKGTDSCIELEVTRQRPMFQSSVCINKREGRQLHLVSVEAEYHGQKALELSISLDPESQQYVNVVMEWKKKELKQALHDITGDLLKDLSLKQFRHQLKQQYRQLKNSHLKHLLRDLEKQWRKTKDSVSRQIRKTIQEQKHQMREQIRQVQRIQRQIRETLKDLMPLDYIQNEIFEPISQIFNCLVDTYYKVVVEHIPEIVQLAWDVTRHQIYECLKKFCIPGTFCHEFVKTYQKHGLKKAVSQMHKKIHHAHKQLQSHVEKHVPIKDFQKWIQKSVKVVKKSLDDMFGQFFGKEIMNQFNKYINNLEKKLRKELLDVYDVIISKVNEMIKKAEKDEDFKAAKSMLKDTQKKIQKAWHRRDQLAKEAWEPLMESMQEKSKQLLESKVEVEAFRPKDGMIRLKIRQPFHKNTIQVISNTLEAAKQKFQEAVSM